MPSCWMKHQFRCCCEGFFLESLDPEESKLPSIRWVGLIQSVKDLKRKDWISLKKKKFDL